MASLKQINKSKWKGEDLFKNRWFCFSCSLQPLWGRRGRGVPLADEFRQREKATNAGMSLYFHQSTALTCTLTTAINCLPVPTVSTLSLHSQLNEKVLPLHFLTFSSSVKCCIPSPRAAAVTPAVHTVSTGCECSPCTHLLCQQQWDSWCTFQIAQWRFY